MDQLTEPDEEPQPELYQCLADMAGAKVEAARESLRDYRVVTASDDEAATARWSYIPTDRLRERLVALRETLRVLPVRGQTREVRAKLRKIWDGGAWLQVPMERRVSIDIVSPGVVMARARMVDDVEPADRSDKEAKPSRSRWR